MRTPDQGVWLYSQARHIELPHHRDATDLPDLVLGHDLPVPDAIDGIASARTAALMDPVGASLGKCLDEFDARLSFPDRG